MNNYTLITGASSGIGLEFAKIAAREKNNLILVARDKNGLEKVKTDILEEFKTAKIDVVVVALDLTKDDSAQQLFELCKEKNFFVSTLINNAGFGDYGNFSQSDKGRQLSMIDLNIRSLTELTHLFLPAMIKQKNGKIMNIGSVASFMPGPLMSVYFASKNYVLSFSEALAEELRGSGVTVTCLCPGSTKTNFGKNAHVSENHSTANPKTTAKEVAQYGWYQMKNGVVVAIYGLGNKITIGLTRFIPRSLLVRLVKKIQK